VLKVRTALGREASSSLGLIDSQSVSTCKGFDGNKKLQGRKRFLITDPFIIDTLGFVLAVVITTSNTGERAGAMLVMAWAAK